MGHITSIKYDPYNPRLPLLVPGSPKLNITGLNLISVAKISHIFKKIIEWRMKCVEG